MWAKNTLNCNILPKSVYYRSPKPFFGPFLSSEVCENVHRHVIVWPKEDNSSLFNIIVLCALPNVFKIVRELWAEQGRMEQELCGLAETGPADHAGILQDELWARQSGTWALFSSWDRASRSGILQDESWARQSETGASCPDTGPAGQTSSKTNQEQGRVEPDISWDRASSKL